MAVIWTWVPALVPSHWSALRSVASILKGVFIAVRWLTWIFSIAQAWA